MSASRVVLCGLARNAAATLADTIARIEDQGTQFADYRVVLYENDSSDDTLSQLLEWSRRNPRVTILTETLGDPVNRPVRCLHRASRMARYRNVYREHIAQHFADFEYAIVLDTDHEGGWSPEGVAHTFGQKEWDFVGSYGIIYKRRYLRANSVVHYDAWAYRRFGSYEPMTTKAANKLAWERGEPLHPVYSCFGGLGIYRTEALVRCRYEGTDVEHVPLHRQMRELGMGRQFLNPSQIVIYGRKRRTWDRFLLGPLGWLSSHGVLFPNKEQPPTRREASAS